MNESDFAEYLNAYVQASTGAPVQFPEVLNWKPHVRRRAALAVAAHDAMVGRAARSPAEVTEEIDRICAGVVVAPPPATAAG